MQETTEADSSGAPSSDGPNEGLLARVNHVVCVDLRAEGPLPNSHWRAAVGNESHLNEVGKKQALLS